MLIGFAPRPLGVDLEWTCKTLDIPALMSDALSPREQEALIALDPAERKAAFLDCWTRKEAYLKAIGAGLSLPPASFEAFFAAATANGFRRVFAGAPWFVGSIAPRENYIGAVAIRDGLWRMEISAFATSSLALPHRKTEVELAGSSQSV